MKQIKYIDGHKIYYCKDSYPKIMVNNHPVKVHRYVWEKKYGKIPDGMEIHHKDFNKQNFNINNLQLMTTEDHRKLHAKRNNFGFSNFGRTKDYVSGCCPAAIPVVLWKGKKKYHFDSLNKAFYFLGKHSLYTLWNILNGKVTDIDGWKMKYARRKELRKAS